MSGLTDALLEELAENSKVQIELLQKMVDQSAGGGGGGGATNLNAVGKSFKTLGFVVGVASGIIGGAFSIALGVASSGLRTLTTMGTALYRAQLGLAETAIAGTGSLSSFYDSLANLPGILGVMSRVFAYHTRVLETNLATFQKMSQTGATLGGNLDMVRQSAKGMYLSMDEFANVMQANVGVIGMLGATVDEGAKNLIRFNTQLIQGNVGRQLLGMGHTIEEVNMMLGSYAAIVGGVRDSDFKNQKRMEQSVKSFAVELDLAAQLEGKTRKEKEDALKKAADQAAVQAMLAGMSADNQVKYLQSLADAESRGQGAVDLLHSQMLGLPPMTEAAQLFYSMNNRAAEAVKQNADMVIDGTTALEARGRIDRNIAIANEATVATYDRMGRTGQALTYSMDATGQAVREMAVSAANAKKLGMETEEKSAKRITESREAIAKAGESEAGAVAQAAGRAKYQGEWLMNLLYGLFKPLEPILLGVVDAFKFVMTTVIPFATDVLNKVMVPLFKDLFGNISFDDIVQPFRDFITGFTGAAKGLSFENVRIALFEFLNPIKNFLGDIIQSIDFKAVGAFFADVFNTVGQFAKDLFTEMATWDWKAIGGWIKWSLVAVGSFIKDLWSGVKAALTGEVTEGGGFLKNAFEKLGLFIRAIVQGIYNSISFMDGTGTLGALGRVFMSLVDIIESIIEIIVAIVENPLVQGVFNILFDVINFVANIVADIVDVISGILNIFQGIFQLLNGDFKNGISSIGEGLGKILFGILDFFGQIIILVYKTIENIIVAVAKQLKSIFNAFIEGFIAIKNGVVNFFSGGYTEFFDKLKSVITDIWSSIVDGFRSKISDISDYFTSGWTDEEEKPAKPARPTQRPTETTPRAEGTPTPRQIPPTPTPQPPTTPSTGGDNSSTAVPESPVQRSTETATTRSETATSRTANIDLTELNTMLDNMKRILVSIDTNTKNTVSSISSLGNRFG